MYWTNACHWAKAPMTLNYTIGEIKELVAEIRKLDRKGMRDEFGDVMYCASLLLAKHTGWNVPMPFAESTIIKHLDRVGMWRTIFREHNLEFKFKYLANGSNYNRPGKIEAALELAREEQL